MSSYKGAYSNEQSTGFFIAVIVVLAVGIMYVLAQRAGAGFTSFVLVGVATITMIYWAFHLRKIITVAKPVFTAPSEQEAKNWVYDLIKDDGKFIFVAEVPGPDSKIAVRLHDAILYIKGSGSFAKQIPIEGSSEMEINDFKYRNGVLTLVISKSETL